MQLFQINNKDKSKHSKNSKYKQIFMKECLKRLNVKAALNACVKKAVSIRQEAAWQLHSRMRQACSSRLHARNCFQKWLSPEFRTTSSDFTDAGRVLLKLVGEFLNANRS